jgi:hypothetical protein
MESFGYLLLRVLFTLTNDITIIKCILIITFTPRQQLIVDQLEDTLFAPNECSWCLTCSCTPDVCYSPEEPDFALH